MVVEEVVVVVVVEEEEAFAPFLSRLSRTPHILAVVMMLVSDGINTYMDRGCWRWPGRYVNE